MENSESQLTIQGISEIVIHAISQSDTSTISKGIESLENIAIIFLKSHEQSPSKYKIVEPSWAQTKESGENLYVQYVMDELFRILTIAGEKKDHLTAISAIRAAEYIALIAMTQEHSEQIVRRFFEQEHQYGSYHLKILEYCIDHDLKDEKERMLSSLRRILDQLFMNESHKTKYIQNYIIYHLFRAFKMIIDKNDIDAFDILLDKFTSSFFKTDFGSSADMIFSVNGRNHDEQARSISKKISNILRWDFIKDYHLTSYYPIKRVPFKKIEPDLERLKKRLTELNEDNVNERISKFNETLRKEHVCLLVE